MTFAIYDMDKTITRRASWLPWLFFYARTEAPLRLLAAPVLLLPAAAYAVGILDRRMLKEWTQALMMGRAADPERVERAARAFAESFGSRYERPEALARIAADRAEGRAIAIATASSAYYARWLALRWGVEHVIATRNRVRHGRISNRIDGMNCYGEAKLGMVAADLDGEKPEALRFYSDHVSDLPMLLWADEPFAVSPSAALRAEAAKRGWPILDWR